MRWRYSRSCPAMSAPLLPDDALLVDVLGVDGLGGLVAGRDGRRGAPDEVPLELGQGLAQRGLGVVVEVLRLADRVQDLRVPAEVVEHLALEPAHVLDRHVVEQSARAGE